MGFFEKGQSKLKMVALMPPREQNIIWYSPVWQNHKINTEIIKGMLRRFSGNQAAKRVVKIQFYENNILIHEVTQ